MRAVGQNLRQGYAIIAGFNCGDFGQCRLPERRIPQRKRLYRSGASKSSVGGVSFAFWPPALSERTSAVRLSEIVSVFQDQCARAIWAHDGIVNKQMGDGLMAIFNFPIKIERHVSAALEAAVDVQRNCASALAALASGRDEALSGPLSVGVGVHTGMVEIGEFSAFRSDFTAIGGVVNLSARLESQAAAGEILVSAEAAAQAPNIMSEAATRVLALKGIGHSVIAHILTPAPALPFAG